MSKAIPVGALRHGDMILGDSERGPTVVTGVESFDHGFVRDLHVLGDHGIFAFAARPDETVKAIRCSAPTVYTELRFLTRDSRILIDPDEPLSFDYGDGVEFIEYVVRDWREVTKPGRSARYIEVCAVPAERGPNPPVTFTEVATHPVRLASCPECAVLTDERDDALAALDRGEVERPGVGAVA